MLSRKLIGKSSIREDRYLYVVATCGRHGAGNQRSSSATEQPNLPTVKYLTLAMINRLGIPDSTSIVGLLDVGPSRTNFDELMKWVAREIAAVSTCSLTYKLTHLERRFRSAVDHFPEL